MLQGLKVREEGKRPGHGGSGPAAVPMTLGPRPGAPVGPVLMGSAGVQQQGPVYSRYDQERFRGKEGTNNSNLNSTKVI